MANKGSKFNPLIKQLITSVIFCLIIGVVSINSPNESEKLPVFTLVDIFHIPPESRQKCTTILGWLATKYPNNYVLTSVRNIIYQLALPHSQLQENAEKELIAAMDSLQGTISNVSGLEPGTYISILTCSVDNKGRTILQKMVEHGLVQALSHTLSQKFWVGAKLNRLLDTEGNNLAHLAAMSENDELVHYVLGIMFKSNIVANMLESVNVHGQKPIDIAILHRDQQTVDTMKNFFRVTTLAEREGFVDGIEVIEDSISLSEKEEDKKLKEFIQKEEMAQKEENKEIQNLEYTKNKKYNEFVGANKENQLNPISQNYESSTDESQVQDSEEEYISKPKNEQVIIQEIEPPSENIEKDNKSLNEDKDLYDNNLIEEKLNGVKVLEEHRANELNKIENAESVLDHDSDKPKAIEPAFASLRGSNDNDEEIPKINKESTNKWSVTAKAIVGASILVGTSILAATVVFIVCKGYNKKEET